MRMYPHKTNLRIFQGLYRIIFCFIFAVQLSKTFLYHEQTRINITGSDNSAF